LIFMINPHYLNPDWDIFRSVKWNGNHFYLSEVPYLLVFPDASFSMVFILGIH
jgi:hypothetical protein